MPGGNSSISFGDDGSSGSTQQRPKQQYVSQSPWATEEDASKPHTTVKYSGQLFVTTPGSAIFVPDARNDNRESAIAIR